MRHRPEHFRTVVKYSARRGPHTIQNLAPDDGVASNTIEFRCELSVEARNCVGQGSCSVE